jgi:pantetheine-phosphate adenylyltransferase
MASTRVAIYPTSSNPPTLGHADIVTRAAWHFEHVYWAAAVNPEKEYLFTQEERKEMMQAYVDHLPGLGNVSVDAYQGPTVRYAQSKGASVLIKGLRSTNDFHGELQQAIGNLGIDPQLETFCLFGRPDLFVVSSTLVREVALLGERIDSYVIPPVAEQIYTILKNQGLLPAK